jgi:hypothetical protein
MFDKLKNLFQKKKPEENALPLHSNRFSKSTNDTDQSTSLRVILDKSELKFYQGGVPKKYRPVVKWIGRLGFIAKGVVYGCIGVLTCTNVSGAWTPNGSQGNESPQVSLE